MHGAATKRVPGSTRGGDYRLATSSSLPICILSPQPARHQHIDRIANPCLGDAKKGATLFKVKHTLRATLFPALGDNPSHY